ncbi:cytochrome P450 [Artemisia annua]|uniref:Cytochrome P450 n=1 Tax=Artemisia annua TaxID=35608 RepID=A0A2U1P1V2_ARTAN|nr:cytochrome P450 [Artemisia annua]
MDLFLSLVIFLASLLGFLLLGHLRWTKNGVKNGLGVIVPEAAGSWPIVGHLHLFSGSQIPHKLLGSMAEKLGPVFTIKLGVHRVLIVSNSEMAKECLTTNDRVFASRPKAMAVELMGYNYAMFAFAPHGSYWREMRKISVLELASHHQTLTSIRVSEVKSCMIDMYRTWLNDKGSSTMVMVDIKEWLENFLLNMVLRMLFGSPFSSEIQNADQFKNAIKRFLELLGAFVPSDIVPSLKWLDLGGFEKKMTETAKEIDVIVDEWLQVHKKKIKSTQKVDGSKDQVFIATLFSRVQEELKLDLCSFSVDAIVKSTCLAIFAAASHTTTVTLTWALALIVNNPPSIVHGFELQNPSNELIDMTESPGFTTPKASPLELLVAPRLLPHMYGEST